MATNKELEREVQELRKLVAQVMGVEVANISATEDVTQRADYIPHGSDKHRQFLGLIEVNDLEDAKRNEYVLYESPDTGKVWRLEDELTPIQAFPGVDPDKVIKMFLRQKVSSFESGPPEVPDYAPPLFVPPPSARY